MTRAGTAAAHAKPAPLRSQRHNNLNELRVFLALCVVIAHAVELAELHALNVLRYVFSSEVAVQAFFILSGFLIPESYRRSKGLADYARKRFLRIYPAYCLVVVLALAIILATQDSARITVGDIMKYLAANLSTLNFLYPSLPGVFADNYTPVINGALWTIKVEIGFYCLVPLLFWGTHKVSLWHCAAAMILIGFLWQQALAAFAGQSGIALHPSLGHQLPGQLQFFGAGLLVYCWSWLGRPTKTQWLALVTVVVAVIAIGQGVNLLKLGVLLLAILLTIRAPSVPGQLSRFDVSYGIYLCHFPAIQLFVATGLSAAMGHLFLFFILLLAVAYGAASWQLIERPALSLARNTRT